MYLDRMVTYKSYQNIFFQESLDFIKKRTSTSVRCQFDSVRVLSIGQFGYGYRGFIYYLTIFGSDLVIAVSDSVRLVKLEIKKPLGKIWFLFDSGFVISDSFGNSS